MSQKVQLAGLFFSFFLVPQVSHAALLYLDPSDALVYRGDAITIALRLDTDEGECVNTVQATLNYTDNIRAVDVSRGDSILNIWLEEPTINDDDNTITLAGGVPGGYCGRINGDPALTNVIAELVFRSPGFAVGGNDAVEASIEVTEQSQVLLHDGFGTPAPLRLGTAELTLSSEAGSAIDDGWTERVTEDSEPPADFSVTLTRDDNAFSNRYFIAFSTVDKQTGVSHYEVMEEPFSEFNLFKWGAVDAPWMRTQSPYVLSDQTLNSTIRVKAIDKAGNETISVLVPDTALRSISRQRLFLSITIGTIGAIILLGVGYALWRRKRDLDAYYDATESAPVTKKK